MTRYELREKARQSLSNSIFSERWLMLLALFLLVELIQSAASIISFGIVGIFLTGPMLYGLSYSSLKLSKTKEIIKIKDLFVGFKENVFIRQVGVSLLSFLFIFLWSLLFVVPGIIALYRYSLVYYISIDNPDLTVGAILDKSKNMMKGHKMDLFILYLSFIGWFFLSILTFGLGFLWLVPYMHQTVAEFYIDLKNKEKGLEEDISN